MAYVTHGAAQARASSHRAGGLAALVLGMLGLLMLAAGAVQVSAVSWSQAATAFAARSWPVAEARILSVSIDEIRIPGPGGVSSELALSASYEFEADGAVVTADRASLADRSGPEDRRLLSVFRRIEFARLTGRTLPAVYDPADPARAFLDPRFPWRDALPRLALAGLFLLVGGQLLARALRR